MGYITPAKLAELAEPMRKNEYGQYLLALIEHKGAIS
jgi:glucose-1-phosphate thymidylyltransferase